MSVAPDRYALKRRLDRYFWTNRSSEMMILSQFFQERLAVFERVAVVGGLVRDFARVGRSGFKSDVDLVIEAPAEQVADFARGLDAIPNRFGGFGVRLGPWKVDFWSLETTWSARHAGVRVDELDDIVRCTFFDWDAVAYDLQSRRLICAPDYLDRLRRGALDVVVRSTPSPEGNLLRSMRRIVLWGLRPGPTLYSFMDECLTEGTFSKVKLTEHRMFGNPVTSAWHDAEDARQFFLAPERFSDCVEDRQLKLDLPSP